jgi:hypothetical protein
MVKNIKKFIEKYEGLFFILIGVIFLRLPTLIEPNRYADEDIYLTLGEAFRRGLVFYRDIHDNKPPLLYFLAGMAGNVSMFRFILMIWSMFGIAFFYVLSGKFFENKKLRIFLTAAFSVLTTIPLLEGNISNGEMFMIVPGIMGILLFFYKWKLERFRYFTIGLLFSIGFLFKVPILFEFLAILFWWTFVRQKGFVDGFKKIFDPNLWIMIGGFIIPILISVFYYYSKEAGEIYLRSALMQNIGYLSSWEGSKPIWQSELVLRGLIVTAGIFWIYVERNRLGKDFGLVAVWFVAALFGSLLSGRPYPHYLIEIVAPACLLLGLVMTARFNLLKWITGIFFFLLLFMSILRYEFWHYENISYYENYLKYVSGKESRLEYLDYFGSGVRRNYEIAEYISKRTDKNDFIYVWGTEPAIYDISNRLPVGRYTVSYHVRDFNGFEETIEAMEKNPPKFIVWFDNESDFKRLRLKLENEYLKVTVFDDASIWKINGFKGLL